MANTTWKQVVYDCADAYRTATSTTAEVPVGTLSDLIGALKPTNKITFSSSTPTANDGIDGDVWVVI